MLNELYSIYRGLDAIGEKPEFRHKEIQEPGAGNLTFRVMLDEVGSVASVKLMTREQIKNCWLIGNGNHNKFPAIKVSFPLIPDAHHGYQDWKETHPRPNEEEYRLLIESMFSQYPTPLNSIDRWPEYRDAILSKKELFESSNECKEVAELYRRYSKTVSGVEILNQVIFKLTESASHGADIKELKYICSLFFGEALKRNGKEIDDTKRITLLLDCFPSAGVDKFASSRDHVSALSNALFENERKGENHKRKKTGICAITGSDADLVSDKFYNVKLAGFLSPILFSKSEGTSGPTVARYRKSGVDAYPMSEMLDRELAGSIEHITAEKFKDKTWAKLPTTGLLISFCKESLDLPLTPLITGESEVDDFDDYLDAAESVLLSFQGKRLDLDVAVDFIEIIKINDGNHKVSYSNTATIDQLTASAKEWEKACKNTPYFKLLAKTKSNENKMCSPWAISPSACIEISKDRYKKDGDAVKTILIKKGDRKVKPPPTISFSDVMTLFLRTHNYAWIEGSLKKICEQYQPLIENCSLSYRQCDLPKDKARAKLDTQKNAKALSAVSLISILLFKIGRKKEKYMNDFAFQLGQLCSAMDELHIGYCKSERKGDIPNTLLGNQVYGMALQNPVRALSVLASRRKPYDSWVRRMRAKNQRTEDKAITAAIFAQIWMSNQAEKLSEFLSLNNLESTDTYKAELMLGYLAGRPFEKNNDSTHDDQGDKS